jgi:ribose 5-phosphate isomerase B
MNEAEIQAIVQRVVRRTLGIEPAPDAGSMPSAPPAAAPATSIQPAQPAAKPSTGPVVAVGADHGGFEMKEAIKQDLAEMGYTVIDCGTESKDAVDYPDYALAVAQLVASGKAWRGIMVDGAGIGSCMAANKVPGVRAALAYDHATAVNSREHNDANVLTLGASLLGLGLVKQLVKIWLTTDFGGGRHAKRVDKIMAIEKQYFK